MHVFFAYYHRRLIAEWLCNRHHHIRDRRHHHVHVVLFVNGVGEILNAGQEAKIMIELSLGHNLECNLVVLDASGNPMLTPVTFDSPPVWTNTTPATETLLTAADGTTTEGTLLAVGTDVVNVTAIIGGKTFTASLAVTVDAAPQVPTSITINAVAK